MKNLHYPTSKILSVSKTVYTTASNVVDQLSIFGIDEQFLEKFAKNIKEAEQFTNSTTSRIELKNLTFNKNESKKDCYNWCDRFKLRLELAYGRNSHVLNSFPNKLFRKALYSDDAMIELMDTALKIAHEHSSELEQYGQAPEILKRGKRIYQKMKQNEELQEQKKIDKIEYTKKRAAKFKELHETIMKINKVGKKVFKNDTSKLPLFKNRFPSKYGKTIKTNVVNTEETKTLHTEVNKLSA